MELLNTAPSQQMAAGSFNFTPLERGILSQDFNFKQQIEDEYQKPRLTGQFRHEPEISEKD